MMLDRVIMVSCRRDMEINRLSVPAVVDMIPAQQYLLVVPQDDVAPFRASMPATVDVLDERAVLPAWQPSRIARHLAPEFAERAGWYLQQFLKIELAAASPPGAAALIWDADSIPLRALTLLDAEGRVAFYTGTECHQPYFDTIERILGLRRNASHSFVAQCMCVRPHWVAGMTAAIESRCGSGWIEAILDNLAPRQRTAFSEYETIGTYVTAMHADAVFQNHRPWFRWGGGYLGDIRKVDAARLQKLARYYDFVAFERWDRGLKAWCRSRVKFAATRVQASRGSTSARLSHS